MKFSFPILASRLLLGAHAFVAADSHVARHEPIMKDIVSKPFKNDSAMISTIPFALSAYWLNERLPEANAAIIRVSSPELPGVGTAKDAQGEKYYSPVIIEAVQKSDYPTFTAFQDAVLKKPLDRKDGTLEYQSGHYATKLTLHTDYSKAPEINSVPVNYSPAKYYDGPYIHGNWSSGVVTIQKGERKLILDFIKAQP